jgi:hypothetical protein
MKGTTEVSEKDLGKTPEPAYVNAPDTLADAVQRLLQAEMLLEDLSRAVEIAMITQSFGLVDSFKQNADDYLQNKIQIVQPDSNDMKITIVTNDD